MKVYQVQSQQSSYALKQNFGMRVSKVARQAIIDAVYCKMLDKSVDLGNKQVLKKLSKIDGVLESLSFYRGIGTWEIVPTIEYSRRNSLHRARGRASAIFTKKPGIDEFISVLENACNDAKAKFDKLR